MDLLTALLRDLTSSICQITGEDNSIYGYGITYENDVFMMHPYCWCEEENCPWCNPKEGERIAPNFYHKKSGLRVQWYKYIGRGTEIENMPDDILSVFVDCKNSLEEEKNGPDVCDFSTNK